MNTWRIIFLKKSVKFRYLGICGVDNFCRHFSANERMLITLGRQYFCIPAGLFAKWATKSGNLMSNNIMSIK